MNRTYTHTTNAQSINDMIVKLTLALVISYFVQKIMFRMFPVVTLVGLFAIWLTSAIAGETGANFIMNAYNRITYR